MPRNALTARFLEAVPGPVSVDPQSEILQVGFKDALLTRPLFLEAVEHRRLVADLDVLRSALLSLPGRLFGGDLTAFARGVGMSDDQISCVLRGRGAAVTRLSRSDLYADASGFRVLEYNMGSAVGGFFAVDIARGLLSDNRLREFVAEHRLEHVDTLQAHVDTIRFETGAVPGTRPVVALAGWPGSYGALAPYVHAVARRWSSLGLDAHGCHLGELEVRDGGVWLREHRIDVINRFFLLEEVASVPGAMELVDPVLDAAERGEVKLFTPMDADLYSCKAALAMLSDEANRGLFDEAELASLDRILPWTRAVRAGDVTLEDGRRVDLIEYAVEHQDDLVLKASMAHGGEGVVLGWEQGRGREEWEGLVRDAADGPFVLQRRVRPVPELFADQEGVLREWVPVWGMFTTATVSGGVVIRAARRDTGTGVINMANGAYVGTAFHAVDDGR